MTTLQPFPASILAAAAPTPVADPVTIVTPPLMSMPPLLV
jgi:hypothetical protein